MPNGSSRTRVVIRDAFGREQEFNSPFYLTNTVLARGLQEYEYSLGFTRNDVGTSSADYDQPALFARHRYGFSASLTAGLRVEARQDLFSGGPSVNVRLPAGQIEWGVAASRSQAQTGWSIGGGYQYAGRPVSVGLSLRAMSVRYATLSLDPFQDRSKYDATGFVAAQVGQRLGLNLQGALFESHAGLHRSRLSLFVTSRVSRNVSIFTLSIPATRIETVDAQGQSSNSEQPAQIDSLAFSPDGINLAGGMCSERKLTTDPETNEQSEVCLQNTILVWEIVSGDLLKQLPTNQSSPVLSLAYNPTDSGSLAVGYGNGSIQFWDLEQERAIGNPLLGAGGPVTSLAFHSDGDILASGSENYLVALWNLNPPQLIGDPLSGSDGSVTGLAFSPDTSQLYSGSSAGTILFWNLADWKETGCDLVQRNFTHNEWEQFFPGEEYRLTCAGIPTPTPTVMPATPTPTAGATATPTP